ncbi:NmrA family NAD(P)-binding protein [Evansella cellulosilytica]|uniref:NmrA family NAD(P)-binding protein n=1 Tax=Evansella cellulosilytica TaxID=1413 RepID=UPI0001C28D37|nr:NmrA family NAD(P)-binding protein [Evansella cellulosilytica]
MGKSSILVTGATGNIGYYVASELAAKGEKVKVALFDPEKEGTKFKEMGVEMVKFDFLDTTTFRGALNNVKKIFLIRPPQLAKPKKDMKPFLDQLKEKGMEQICICFSYGSRKKSHRSTPKN